MEKPESLIPQCSCDQILMTQYGTLPIEPKITIQKKGYLLDSYSDLNNNKIISFKTLSQISNEAFTIKMPSTEVYTIAHNDFLTSIETRFALAHELAHIGLNHFNHKNATLLKFDKTNLIIDRKKAPLLEREADIFAANFLCPSPLIEMWNISIKEISKVFNVSLNAAAYVKKHALEDCKYIDADTKYKIKHLFYNQMTELCFEKY